MVDFEENNDDEDNAINAPTSITSTSPSISSFEERKNIKEKLLGLVVADEENIATTTYTTTTYVPSSISSLSDRNNIENKIRNILEDNRNDGDIKYISTSKK